MFTSVEDSGCVIFFTRIRNEWIGWGNVNKKNVYMIDYEYLKAQIEADSQICIF